MTAQGWTVDDALAQFAAAGKPLDPAGFRALVRHARRLGNLEKAGETTSGELGGRGCMVFEIGQMQLMHKDLVRWLGLSPSGDTCPPSLDAGLLSLILALESYARVHPGAASRSARLSPRPRTIGSLPGPTSTLSPPGPDAGPDAHPGQETHHGAGHLGVLRPAGLRHVPRLRLLLPLHPPPRNPEVTMDDGYDLLAVRIKRGTAVNGAVVALCPDEAGVVTADVCIDGHTVP